MKFKSHPLRSEGRALHRRIATLLCIVGGLGSLGCGNSVYAVRAAQAAEAFNEAKEMGAEKRAPYEYYSAKLRISEAQRQAAQAEYGNAAHLSREARGYSVLAIKRMQSAKNQADSSQKSAAVQANEAADSLDLKQGSE